MLRLDKVIKPWKESAALNDHINLYGFWNETGLDRPGHETLSRYWTFVSLGRTLSLVKIAHFHREPATGMPSPL